MVPLLCERLLAADGTVAVPGNAGAIPGTGHSGATAVVSRTVIVGGGRSGPIEPTPRGGGGRDGVGRLAREEAGGGGGGVAAPARLSAAVRIDTASSNEPHGDIEYRAVRVAPGEPAP